MKGTYFPPRSGQVHNVIPPLLSPGAALAPRITAVRRTSPQRWASSSARLHCGRPHTQQQQQKTVSQCGPRILHHSTSSYVTPAVGVIQRMARRRPHTQNTALRGGLHTLHTILRKTSPSGGRHPVHGSTAVAHTHTNTRDTVLRGDLRTLHHNT